MFKLRHYTVSLAHFEFDGNTSQKMEKKTNSWRNILQLIG